LVRFRLSLACIHRPVSSAPGSTHASQMHLVACFTAAKSMREVVWFSLVPHRSLLSTSVPHCHTCALSAPRRLGWKEMKYIFISPRTGSAWVAACRQPSSDACPGIQTPWTQVDWMPVLARTVVPITPNIPHHAANKSRSKRVWPYVQLWSLHI